MASEETTADLMSLMLFDENQPLSLPRTPDIFAGSDHDLNGSSDTSATELSDSPPVLNPDKTKKEADAAAIDEYLELHTAQDRKETTSLVINSQSHYNHVSASSRIIDQVRDYQQELFERAKEENVIAV